MSRFNMKDFGATNKYKLPATYIDEITRKKRDIKSYRVWINTLTRSYSESRHKKQPTYIGCSVCEEWKEYSNFKRWYDINYKDGYQLDKDLLARDNKVYCPEHCRFVPQRINSLILDSKATRGENPQGVSFHIGRKKYHAKLSKDGKRLHLGYYNTPEEASAAYIEAKEAYVKEVAAEYYAKGLICKDIKDSLMVWTVNQTGETDE